MPSTVLAELVIVRVSFGDESDGV
jgi:hypothetical protein